MTNLNQEDYRSPNLEIPKVTGNNGENSCCEKEGNKIVTADILFSPFWLLGNTKEKMKREEVEEKGERRKNKERCFF